MCWQIAEYTVDGGPPQEFRTPGDSGYIRVAVIQAGLTQAEAIGRAQRMNDAVDTDEFWFVAERTQ